MVDGYNSFEGAETGLALSGINPFFSEETRIDSPDSGLSIFDMTQNDPK
jgi:hypothetical protein